MSLGLASLVGLIAGSLSPYSFVPQVVKCWRTGDTEAVSFRMFAVRAFGLLLWTLYGFTVGSLPVLIFSALSLVLSSSMVIMKVRGARASTTG